MKRALNTATNLRRLKEAAIFIFEWKVLIKYTNRQEAKYYAGEYERTKEEETRIMKPISKYVS